MSINNHWGGNNMNELSIKLCVTDEQTINEESFAFKENTIRRVDHILD